MEKFTTTHRSAAGIVCEVFEKQTKVHVNMGKLSLKTGFRNAHRANALLFAVEG